MASAGGPSGRLQSAALVGGVGRQGIRVLRRAHRYLPIT